MSETDCLRGRPVAPEAFYNAFPMFRPNRGQRARARACCRRTMEPPRTQPGPAGFRRGAGDGFAALFGEAGETAGH